MGKTLATCVFLPAVLLAAGCDGGSGKDVPVGEAEPGPQDPEFLAGHERWRQERLESLTRPDGWASLVGLHWIELKAHYIGSGGTNGIRLAKGPEKLGLLQQEGGRVYLTPEKGVALTVDGAPAKGRFELRSDREGQPTVVGFDDGKGQLTLIERNGRKALRVKHAEADSLVRFGTLEYWPADASWRIEGRFLPHPPGRTIDILDITGVVGPQPNPGAVEFERGGRTYRLEALEGEDGTLFLIFADRTSGHGSYGAGRYLYAPPPDAQGKVVLDFNRAYNPPCAFTDFATCPLPPPENRLDLAVTAGEKKYRRP